VLDGEAVVVTRDGRADFELLAARVHGRRHSSESHPVTFFVFDVLRVGRDQVCGQQWWARRQILDDLDLAAGTGGAAQPSIWSDDGAAMHQATRAVGAEGTVSKRADSGYRPGRSRQWLKAKHQAVETFQVAGWRPSRPGRPGGLLIAEAGEPVGLATLAVSEDQRAALVELLRRYGRSHPTGTITIPSDCIQAVVRYTSRTPNPRAPARSVVLAIEPAGSVGSHSALPSSHDRTGVR
jgi:ATP-dependent DNA ligase